MQNKPSLYSCWSCALIEAAACPTACFDQASAMVEDFWGFETSSRSLNTHLHLTHSNWSSGTTLKTQTAAYLPTADVRAQTCLSPGSCWRLHWWVELWQVPGDLVHEPLEAFAVEVVAKLLLSGDVARGEVPVLGSALVNVLCIFIHPHLSHPLQVLGGRTRGETTWECCTNHH